MKKQVFYLIAFIFIWTLVAEVSRLIGNLLGQDWWADWRRYVVIGVAAVLAAKFSPKLSRWMDSLSQKKS